MAIRIYNKTDRTSISKNFKVREFSCNCNGHCSTTKIDDKLVEYLQNIRDHFGKAVTINSGYRCPTHNKNIGGASASRHVSGEAADIVVSGVAPAEVAKYAESIGVKGIGLYEANDGNFVHVDTRPTKSFWYGHAQVYRSTFGGGPKTNEYTLEQFIRDVQGVTGATVDGIAGPQTLSKTPTLSAKTNSRHAAVKFVQRRLLELGYTEVGRADGIAGAKFTSGVAHFQEDNDCYVDGIITAKNKTWKKLLGMA